MAYVTPEGYTFNSLDQYNNYMGIGGGYSPFYTQEEINNWGSLTDPMIMANMAPTLRSKADIMAPVPSTLPTLRDKANISVFDTLKDKTSNSIGTWTSAMDTPNLVNAGVTALLTGLSTLGNYLSVKGVFDLYKEQEKLEIQNANEQARRIQIKGDILLSNLETKHALEQGKNELAVAGSGAGAISGSFLDKLMSNYKYNTKDEHTQSLETLWAVDNARRQGLIQAINTAGKAAQTAYQLKGQALSGLFSGLKAGASSLLADKRQYDMNVADNRSIMNTIAAGFEKIEAKYGSADTALGFGDVASYDHLKINDNTGSNFRLNSVGIPEDSVYNESLLEI